MSEYSQVPILTLTAEASPSLLREALEAGATHLLPLSSSQTALGAKLRSLPALSTALRERDDRAGELAREAGGGARVLRDREEGRTVRLAHVVGCRDSETGGQTWRVASYSGMIAAELGLSEAGCRDIYLAASLHDVGKVAVPDHILLKPGPLTDEEAVVMRDHARIGRQIPGDSASELMSLAAGIAGHYHERWDSAGYPSRLAGGRNRPRCPHRGCRRRVRRDDDEPSLQGSHGCLGGARRPRG
jgi:putative two-component system response regulator